MFVVLPVTITWFDHYPMYTYTAVYKSVQLLCQFKKEGGGGGRQMEKERPEGRKQEVRTEPSYVGWSKAQFPWLEHTSKLKEDSKTANGGFPRNGGK